MGDDKTLSREGEQLPPKWELHEAAAKRGSQREYPCEREYAAALPKAGGRTVMREGKGYSKSTGIHYTGNS